MFINEDDFNVLLQAEGISNRITKTKAQKGDFSKLSRVEVCIVRELGANREGCPSDVHIKFLTSE